jgi:hypothetical protein
VQITNLQCPDEWDSGRETSIFVQHVVYDFRWSGFKLRLRVGLVSFT